MKDSFFASSNGLILPRRRALALSGAVLSASAVALLGGRDAMAANHKSSHGATATDVKILNQALAAELQAIAAYQVGADSGLLTSAKPVALEFQGHHKAHAAALAGAIRKLGGTPVAAKEKYSFPTESLKNQNDVLGFAAGLEKGAVGAYLGAVPMFGDRSLAQVAASILGDEAMHWAVLRQALGQEPVPMAFMA